MSRELTDLQFRTREAMKIIKEMRIYSDILWDFVRRVAVGDMAYSDVVDEAKNLFGETN